MLIRIYKFETGFEVFYLLVEWSCFANKPPKWNATLLHIYYIHTGDIDFVSNFVSDYFAFCTSCLHFSHFVLNPQKILLDIYCGYCWIYTAKYLGSNLNTISFTVKIVFNTVNGILLWYYSYIFQLCYKTSEFTECFGLISWKRLKLLWHEI